MSAPASLDAPEIAGLLVERSEGVLTITFDQPDQGNPITPAMTDRLASLFMSTAADPSVRCVVVRGSGRHFSAGGDVAGFARTLEMSPEERAQMFRARLDRAAVLVKAVVALDRPIIARHRGAAAGAGLLFVLASDVVVADATASFVFAHQRVGLPPDAGVSFLLPFVVGWRAAKRLLLTAARVEADEALRLGLLDILHPADGLDAEVARWAQSFANAPTGALRSAKRLVNDASFGDLSLRLEAERDAIAAAVATDDFVEGVRAFLEKRRAVFPSTQ